MKFTLHPYARDLAVGFWVGSEGRETVQNGFTVYGFNQLEGRQLAPNTNQSDHRKKDVHTKL